MIELQFMNKSGTVIHARGAYDYDGFALIPSVGDIVRLSGRRWKVLERIFDYMENNLDLRATFTCEEA
jgi:hypothetical protein